MALELQQQEQIDRYLDGEMSSAERLAFEQTVAQNPELAQGLELNRQINETLADKQEAQLLHTIQQLRRSTQHQAKRLFLVPRTLRWAAAMLLLVVVALVLRFFLAPPTNEQLFAKYYVPQTLNLTEMSAEVPAANLQQALQTYKDGDKMAALPLFEAYLQSEPAHWEVRLAYANALLETDQASAAIPEYDRIIQSGSSFKQEAEWHKALALLQQGNPTASKEILANIVAQPAHDFKNPAQLLLAQLN